MKRRQKKLVLNRETLRNLQGPVLRYVGGARSEDTRCPAMTICTCQTGPFNPASVTTCPPEEPVVTGPFDPNCPSYSGGTCTLEC
jgi:hypothetical protein